MRIVRVHDLRLPLPDDLRQFPRRGEIDLVDRRERDKIGTFRGAAKQLALAMRDEDGSMAAGPQSENG